MNVPRRYKKRTNLIKVVLFYFETARRTIEKLLFLFQLVVLTKLAEKESLLDELQQPSRNHAKMSRVYTFPARVNLVGETYTARRIQETVTI